MDLISSLLKSFHLSTTVFERSRFCGHWRVDHPGGEQASFHLIASGRCWLDRLDGSPPLGLEEGDLLILPRDAPHHLSDVAAPKRTAGEPRRADLADTEAGGTGIVCGYFVFDEGTSNPILDALPEYVLIRAAELGRSHSLRGIVALLVEEAASRRPGSEAMIDRLSDALFIQVVRHHLERHPGDSTLGAALADQAVHRALQCLHDAPERDWDLPTLANAAAVSRSTLVARFRASVGVSPMRYLKQWRLRLAHRLLRQGHSVSEACRHCGYVTEAGFSKAFKRHFGISPGAVRGRGGPAGQTP
ncbi:AraC family transcriptional regulator [Arhodomonas aquaeolei]|uniref:AraC family transcriptional regulator n=1 Tax=Arhodomonas aquaeolei TaxID=2369 RepID=UPI00036F20BF|nr:AraC family transcriptional regulator [Arhodomonas aquaeolei]